MFDSWWKNEPNQTENLLDDPEVAEPIIVNAYDHVYSATFLGEDVVSGGEEKFIRRWRDDLQVGPPMYAGDIVFSVATSQDCRWIVGGSWAGGVKSEAGLGRVAVWDAETHNKVMEIDAHDNKVSAMDVSPDGTRIATGSYDKTVSVLSLSTGQRLLGPWKHSHWVVAAKYSPGGEYIATATWMFITGSVRVYDARNGRLIVDVALKVSMSLNNSLSWASDGEQLFALSADNYIHRLNPFTGTTLSKWQIERKSIFCGITCQQNIIVASSGHYVSLWDIASQEQIGVFKNTHSTSSMAISRDFNLMTSGEKMITLRNLHDILPLYLVRPGSRQWEDVLEDAGKAMQADPSSHYPYERAYAALHHLGLYDAAAWTFETILQQIQQSDDPDIRKLRKNYVSISEKQKAIEDVVRMTSRRGPLVLIDVKTGRLRDRQALPDLFRSDPTFKELVTSTTGEIDKVRIEKSVSNYFGYVMLSHVWGDGEEEEKKNEPSFQLLESSGSVRRLPETPMNSKLRNFCSQVKKLGYRWAWSDTCCIDKSDDAVLNRSLRSMYKWYEESDATLVYFGDVSSDLGNIIRSLWMTRAWTLQEALAPKRILFFDRHWKPYRGIFADNHKEVRVILQELANATGVPSQSLVAFRPDSLGVREKLRLASMRSATIEEDMAYSLIGIFKSDIIPRYGEGEDALGHLLEGIVAHLGEVAVLAWTGKQSSYNSCLPSSLVVYSQTPYMSPTVDRVEMELRTAQLSTTSSRDGVMDIYHRVMRLPPARFANRRLQLPCIVFRIGSLGLKGWDDHGNHYRAKVSGLGTMEFTMVDLLSADEARRLALVHPWIGDIRGGAKVDVTNLDDETDFNWMDARRTDEEFRVASPSLSSPPPAVDEYGLALEMIVRLLQPFNALLLLQQPGGEYIRVGAEREIVVRMNHIFKPNDICTEVLDVL